MSPVVRLHCYPLEDGDCTSGVSLEMDLPDSVPIVEDVLATLRATYPRVAIRVEPGGDEVAVWHVHRDGLPV